MRSSGLSSISPESTSHSCSHIRCLGPPEQLPVPLRVWAFFGFSVLVFGWSCLFAFGCGPSRYDPRLLPSAWGAAAGSSPSHGSHDASVSPAPVQPHPPHPPAPVSPAVCPPGLAHCDADTSACESLSTVENCGSCGARCSSTHGVASCIGGQCVLTGCARFFGDCDGNPLNGCETDTRTNVWHCGTCGRACGFSPGATAGACDDGECEIASCLPGLGDCDGAHANGCEQVLNTQEHCGACGSGCGGEGAYATCMPQGWCQFHGCAPGYADCEGQGQCESLRSEDHCGVCWVQCPRGTRCQAGVCR